MLDNTNIYLSSSNSKNHLEVFKSQHKVMETGYGITDTWDEIVEAMLE
ncbi:hypothetical protein Tco_1007298, partial [Tanacetum coccineum]